MLDQLSDFQFGLLFLALFLLILLAGGIFVDYFGDKKDYLPPPKKDSRLYSAKKKW